MSPERRRAWERLRALPVPLTFSTVNAALVDAYEEVEHTRPIVDVAKALVDAKSGEARALAIEALFGAVAKLREAGR